MLLEATVTAQPEAGPWPREVEMILSAMDAAAGNDSHFDRRTGERRSYRAVASLQLHADQHQQEPRTLYVRDAHPGGIGFITPHLLPLGYGGRVSVQVPGGQWVTVECTVYRCRRVLQGWYEGAIRFNTDVWQFE